jgi:hypothetical protein
MADAMIWRETIRLHELAQGPVRRQLAPDAAERAAIAADLELTSLPAFTADLEVRPWMDGAQVSGRLQAVVEQVCGVTLDPFEQPLESEFEVRFVPSGSPHLLTPESGELELDLDAPEPPDPLEGDVIDLAGCVVEQLALALDPFPRKPDAVFDYQPPEQVTSPFAALRKLTEPKG